MRHKVDGRERIARRNWSRRINVARRGFTMIELLVSIGLIGVLLSLLMPGIQHTRESARRMQCLNNLRQLGLACANHAAALSAFPQTMSGYNEPIDLTEDTSPHSRLLPYLDLPAVFGRVDFGEDGHGAQMSPPTSSLNAQMLATTVPQFLCPSDSAPAGGNNYRANFGPGPSFSLGVGPENGTGAFTNWTARRPQDFRDGLSKTIFFSEKLVGDYDPTVFTPSRDSFLYTAAPIYTTADAEVACTFLPSPDPDHDSYGGASWLFGGLRFTWYNHVRGPNSPLLDCEVRIDGSGATTARSFHVGGVNVVLGDGSARLVSASIDLQTWRALSTRAGGDVVGDY